MGILFWNTLYNTHIKKIGIGRTKVNAVNTYLNTYYKRSAIDGALTVVTRLRN